MEQGLLHLHSFLRWVIILLLLVTIIQAFGKKPGLRKSSLWLLISAHIMFVVGVYQLIAGRYGIINGMPPGVELMKSDLYRFFWVEHPLMMFAAIVLITIARGKAKILNYKSAGWLLLVALILILVAVPWPFREIEGGPERTWFPGM